MPPWKIVALLSFLLFTAGCENNAPYVDWKTVQTDTFVLQPGATFTGYFVPKASVYGYRPKVLIEAKSPITIGYIHERYRETMMTNPDALAREPIIFCFQQHVLSTTLECPLNNLNDGGFFLWVRDERTSGQMLGAGILGGLGVRGPAQQAAIRNDVHVVYSAYTCVRNCAPYQ